MLDAQTLHKLAQKLRLISIQSTTEAKSGHPTTCMSMADLMATLFFDEMYFDPRDPYRAGADSFVLSKGHAAPILWAALHEAGAIKEDPLTLRKFTSPLEGHPTPRVPWVRVATGSLGQGICAAVGMALARRLKQDPGRLYSILGDGECAEGSVWEAVELGAHYKLDNLVAIVDMNGLGQSGPTLYDHDTEGMCAKFRAFGWHAFPLDGHDIADIQKAFARARESKGAPSVLVARTLKGKGVSFVEGKEGWHGKPFSKEELARAIPELGPTDVTVRVEPRVRGTASAAPPEPKEPAADLTYKLGDELATREAYGSALVRLGGTDKRIVVLDAEVKNSTYTEKFKKAHGDRFVECYIAEQNMVGMALGFAAEGFVPCASSFACFLSRAFDFVRMGAYSRPKHLILCGSHAGISIGEDGPSQMALEDLAMMRSILDSTVLYPSDAVSAERLTEEAIRVGGIVYLRTSRPKTKVIYKTDERFPVGGSKILGRSPSDVATIVAAGVTVYEALTAQEALAKENIRVRVLDAYSIKPIDQESLRGCARETGGMVVVEDHAAWGGLGDAVASTVSGVPIEHLAVREIPRSGTPQELLEHYGISSGAIIAAVKRLAKK